MSVWRTKNERYMLMHRTNEHRFAFFRYLNACRAIPLIPFPQKSHKLPHRFLYYFLSRYMAVVVVVVVVFFVFGFGFGFISSPYFVSFCRFLDRPRLQMPSHRHENGFIALCGAHTVTLDSTQKKIKNTTTKIVCTRITTHTKSK